jgi:hypothetical protein
MPLHDAPIRVEGRRLREIQVSPKVAATALALLLVAFVAWIASMLTTSAPLAAIAGVAGAGAVVMAALHTWRRLTRRGRWVFGVPIALLPIAFVFATLGLPGATVIGYAAAFSVVIAIGLGVAGRPGMSATFALARAQVDASLVRSEEPSEAVTLLLDEQGLQLGEETWALGEIATARLDTRGARPALRVTDRMGDEIAVEVEEGSVAGALEVVERVGGGR